ncbi:N-acetyldiaminopimelate deacetylase [Paenibacillus sp. GCM10023252]|uniref:N-acetyldiaminopimelate deacetylase n=1 Tax=Paenibacillus sp. GCM10023252 TaxID=3252649 RepID=UPI003617AD0E
MTWTSTVDPQTYINLRRRLHEIPEPGFKEFKTQALLLDYIHSLPQERIEIRTWRTGILVKVRGAGSEAAGRRIVAYRTDIDGLPIEEQTGYAFASQHPGYMHACGHDLHMAIALGALTETVNREPYQDDVLFIFQPAEEGPGGAKPMLASEQLQDWMPDFIFALHIAPGYPVGTIATRPGTLFAHASMLNIELIGRGGHAAVPQAANDMIVAGAHLITQLQTIVSRNVDPTEGAVVTIGKITGGTKANIIADRVVLEGTIRTLSAASTALVRKRIEAVVRGVEAAYECKASIDYGAHYIHVHNDEAETAELLQFTAEHGLAETVRCEASMVGEDFGFFLERIPGVMFWLGADCSQELHHAELQPKEEAIAHGVSLVSAYLAHKAGVAGAAYEAR